MNRPASAFALALTLAASALAQNDATPSQPRPAVFTLPAGSHDVQAFLGLTAQIRKAAIHYDAAGSETAARPIVVRRELQLDAPSFEDVATTLLFERGVLLVRDEPRRGLRAIAIAATKPEASMAVRRTAAEVLARPSRLEYVTTSVPCAEGQAAPRINLLRPFFAARGGAWRLRLEVEAETLRLTGTTRQVVLALTLLQLKDGATPPAAPRPTWAGADALRWPGGAMEMQRFVDLVGERLDANVLGDITPHNLDLGAPAELPAEQWYARATQVLRAVDQVLVPIDPARRIFALGPLRGPDVMSLWYAGYEPAATVATAETIVPVLTVVELQHATVTEAMNWVRPRLMGSPTLTWGSIGPRQLLLCGLRDEVVKGVAGLREAEAAKNR